MDIRWEAATKIKFDQMLEKIPVFMRGIAQDKVSKCAEDLARKENRNEVTEKDMIDAFFKATPFGFHGPMKTDMDDLGIDYAKYGYDR